MLRACRIAHLRQQAVVAAGGSWLPPPAVRATSSSAAGEGAVLDAPPRTRGLQSRSETGRLPVSAPPLVYHPLYSAPQLAPGHR